MIDVLFVLFFIHVDVHHVNCGFVHKNLFRTNFKAELFNTINH